MSAKTLPAQSATGFCRSPISRRPTGSNSLGFQSARLRTIRPQSMQHLRSDRRKSWSHRRIPCSSRARRRCSSIAGRRCLPSISASTTLRTGSATCFPRCFWPQGSPASRRPTRLKNRPRPYSRP